MIATRQRPPRRRLGRLVLPLAALAALAVALGWPPSRTALANGPLAPVFSAAGAAGGQAVRPFTFAVQQRRLADQDHELAGLRAQVDAERKRSADLEARRADADRRLAAAQTEALAASAATPAPVPSPALSPGAAARPADESARRIGAAWAAMDPEKAAAVARRLPEDEVARIFAGMAPDAVGPILEALPAAVAARIQTANP